MKYDEAMSVWHRAWIEAGLCYRDLTHLKELSVAWLHAGAKLDLLKEAEGTQAEDLAQHCFAAAMLEMTALMAL